MSFGDRFGFEDVDGVTRDRGDSTFSFTDKTGTSLEGVTGLAMNRKTWTRDKDAKNCMACGTSFGLTNRKHHCRSCGGVFCDPCTKHRETLQKVTERGTKTRESRVCARCSANHAIEKEEPLFKLLGPELGPNYYYRFKRCGYGDLQQLNGLSSEQITDVLCRADIPERYRANITKKLKDFSALSSGNIRGAVMMRKASTTNLNDSGRFGLSPPAQPRVGSLDDSCGALGTSLPARTDSPRGRLGSIHQNTDGKLIKKKLTEELAQMDVTKEHMLSQLQVLDASIAAQRQTLTRLKQVTDEEEGKHGALESISDELFNLKAEARATAEADANRLADMDSAAAAAESESASRRKEFLKGQHRSTNCMLCLKSFTLMDREHHCRVCYRSCCNTCSSRRGKARSARCCDWCRMQQTLESSHWQREVTDSREFRLVNYKQIRSAVGAIKASDHNAASLGITSPYEGRGQQQDDSDSDLMDPATEAKAATLRARGTLD